MKKKGEKQMKKKKLKQKRYANQKNKPSKKKYKPIPIRGRRFRVLLFVCGGITVFSFKVAPLSPFTNSFSVLFAVNFFNYAFD